jgi:hypothetical protein
MKIARGRIHACAQQGQGDPESGEYTEVKEFWDKD